MNNLLSLLSLIIFLSTKIYSQADPKAKEPLLLQDHHCLVSYRNMWIRELNSE